MNNTTGVNKTSEFLLKKEIIVTEMNTQRLEIITILLSRLRNDGNKNGYKFSVSLRELKL